MARTREPFERTSENSTCEPFSRLSGPERGLHSGHLLEPALSLNPRSRTSLPATPIRAARGSLRPGCSARAASTCSRATRSCPPATRVASRSAGAGSDVARDARRRPAGENKWGLPSCCRSRRPIESSSATDTSSGAPRRSAHTAATNFKLQKNVVETASRNRRRRRRRVYTSTCIRFAKMCR